MMEFMQAIRAHGLEPPPQIIPGKLHRFPGYGKRPGNSAGWCRLFPDQLGGCFGDWSTGLSEVWQGKQPKIFSRSEREAFWKQVKTAQQAVKEERKQQQARAAQNAVRIWEHAIPAPSDYPYLLKKMIQPHGARLYKGVLVVPVVDFGGILHSLQFIHSDGTKLFLFGGRKKGCFIVINEQLEQAQRVVICEGWATACTLAEEEPESTVLAALDAGNLKPVATAARNHWPDTEIIIAGDDDRQTKGNPGRTKAREAAQATGALVAFPQWPDDAPQHLTDFNDLKCWKRRWKP